MIAEDLTYECSQYDYREGTLICVLPGKIGGVENNGEVFRIEGWALLFLPELLHGTPLAAHPPCHGRADSNGQAHLSQENSRRLPVYR